MKKFLHILLWLFGCAVVSPAGPAAMAAPARGLDRPLRVIQTVEPQFPLPLKVLGVLEGAAHLVFTVDADDRLTDFLVTSYTHEEFGEAAAEALRAWAFEAPIWGGEKQSVRCGIRFQFRQEGVVSSVTPSEMLGLFLKDLIGQKSVNRVVRSAELDHPLTLVESVSPRRPESHFAPEGGVASAVLDFYVDESGRPRMPVVDQADHAIFAAAAVEALEQWRFYPPTSDGKPVLVKVRQAFRFSYDS